MNQSEVNNLVTMLAAATAPLLVKLGVDGPTWAALLTAAVPVGWGIYSHWNMKKVPEKAEVVK